MAVVQMDVKGLKVGFALSADERAPVNETIA